MKKIISLLAAALLLSVFAAGCGGKMKDCKDANGKGKTACQKKEDFENNKECVWKGKTDDDKDGKCEDKPAAYTETTDDKAVCTGVNGDSDTACETAHKGLAANKQISDAAKNAQYKCKAVTAGTSGPCVLGK